LQDRYGALPPPVQNLLEYASLKLLCIKIGVTSIDRKRDLVQLKFKPNAAIDPVKLAQFVSSQRGAQFAPDGTLRFSMKENRAEDVLGRLRSLLGELSGEVTEPAGASVQ